VLEFRPLLKQRVARRAEPAIRMAPGAVKLTTSGDGRWVHVAINTASNAVIREFDALSRTVTLSWRFNLWEARAHRRVPWAVASGRLDR
jgi:hypothetical protein